MQERISQFLRRKFELLPDEALQLMDAAGPENLGADTNDSALGFDDSELQRLLRTRDVDSLHRFLDVHHRLNPDTIALLEVDENMFIDLIWMGAWTVPQLEEKMASGEISPQTLGRVGREGPQQRFEKLQDEVKRWHRIKDLG